MKILLYSDNHWSQYSSIVRKRGANYSIRLENQIASLNWAMRLAEEKQCFITVCLGDFFDKAELNSEEISALKEINWAGMTNMFIAGNHEMGMFNHLYSSIKVFNLLDTGDVISTPAFLGFKGNTEIFVLPYILENERKPLSEYMPPKTDKKRIILSHNDIAGVQMGQFISEAGFSIEEIEENCDLFINGHLHNGGKVTDKIINIGNLTGQNFSEDATQYDHCVFILDTETLKIEVYENPFALNFYKLDATVKEPNLKELKQNSVVTLKCVEEDLSKYRNELDNSNNIIESRLLIIPKITRDNSYDIESLSVDHLAKFREYILSTMGSNDIINSEIAEICK